MFPISSGNILRIYDARLFHYRSRSSGSQCAKTAGVVAAAGAASLH